MTLKIVNHNGVSEVHSVRIDDGVISIIDIETGESVSSGTKALEQFIHPFNKLAQFTRFTTGCLYVFRVQTHISITQRNEEKR